MYILIYIPSIPHPSTTDGGWMDNGCMHAHAFICMHLHLYACCVCYACYVSCACYVYCMCCICCFIVRARTQSELSLSFRSVAFAALSFAYEHIHTCVSRHVQARDRDSHRDRDGRRHRHRDMAGTVTWTWYCDRSGPAKPSKHVHSNSCCALVGHSLGGYVGHFNFVLGPRILETTLGNY